MAQGYIDGVIDALREADWPANSAEIINRLVIGYAERRVTTAPERQPVRQVPTSGPLWPHRRPAEEV